MYNKQLIFDDLDLFFQNLLSPRSGWQPLTVKPDYPTDIYSDSDGLTIEVPIVDGNINDIEVVRSGDEIKVLYHRPDVDTSNRKYQQRGIAKRDFEFLWRIGNKYDVSLMTTSYDNGLLKLTVPWAKSALPERVEIQTVKSLVTGTK